MRALMSLALAFLGLACGPGAADVTPQPGTGEESTSTSTGEESTDEESTSTGEESTSTGATDCDSEAMFACLDPLSEERSACLDGCGAILACEDEACRWGCLVNHRLATWACEDTWCPQSVSERTLCQHECHQQALDCAQDQACETLACSYAEVECMEEICVNPCELVPVDFAWEGSCELQLPAELALSRAPFASVEIADAGGGYSIDTQGCTDPWIGATWVGENFERFTLCEPLCAAFADAGVLRFNYSGPPCD